MEREYLYEVTVRCLIGLNIPPDHPDIKQSIRENTADYLANVVGAKFEKGSPKGLVAPIVYGARLVDPDSWDGLIDGFKLVDTTPDDEPGHKGHVHNPEMAGRE